MANIVEIKFNITHDLSAWECLGQIEDNIGILSNNLKTQVLDIMGYGLGCFTPGLHALRIGDRLLIQYNNYGVNHGTHTIELNLTEDLAIYRPILKGSIHQFEYGNFFKLEGRNIVQILDFGFEVIETFDRVNALEYNQRYKMFYIGVQNGIFDSITGQKVYLMGKLMWGNVIQTGVRKGEQIFLMKSMSNDNHYFIIDCNGNPFENEDEISSFHYCGKNELDSFSVAAASDSGSLLLNLHNQLMVMNSHGFFTIETDLIIHSNDGKIYAYHPRVTDKYGYYRKVYFPTSMLDDIKQDYIGEVSYQLFDNIETPIMVNT